MKRILQYTFTLAAIILLSACAKEENKVSSVPFGKVDFSIETLIEHEFNNSFYWKKYTNMGYAGVIVISSNLQDVSVMNIYAYDLCCPYEAPIKNEIQVLSNRLHAQCPKCKTVYHIADGTGRVIPFKDGAGQIISAPGTERLKRYNVMREGTRFRIRN